MDSTGPSRSQLSWSQLLAADCLTPMFKLMVARRDLAGSDLSFPPTCFWVFGDDACGDLAGADYVAALAATRHSLICNHLGGGD
jgi:hypothetical protein